MQQLVAIILSCLIAFSAAASKDIHPTDQGWLSTLQGLQAGDVLTVHEGTYTLTAKFSATWTGTESNPIVVQAASGEGRPKFVQTTGENIWNLNGAYFAVKGLEFTGGSRGIRLGESTSKKSKSRIYQLILGTNHSLQALLMLFLMASTSTTLLPTHSTQMTLEEPTRILP